MVKLNSALVALNKRIHVKYLNSNRKPRHVDNGMVGLFSLSMERDKGVKARWVDAGLVDAHPSLELFLTLFVIFSNILDEL
ncbi:hypothetical protein H0H92_003066 [Tricholoma furcatifolium]|nr:hypothetical protein H0H92_003066 [Tricholoma furcatifolium]